MPSPHDTPDANISFNVLLDVEEAVALVVASQNLDKIFVFDF
jgi:hypothetical protein